MLLSVPKLYDKYSTLKWHFKKYVQFSHIKDHTFHLFQKKFSCNGMDSHLPFFFNVWCSYFLKWSWVKCVSFGWSRWVLDGKIINMNNLERLGWNYLVFRLMKGIFEVNLSPLPSFYRQRNGSPWRLLVNLRPYISLVPSFLISFPPPPILVTFLHQLFHLPYIFSFSFAVSFR